MKDLKRLEYWALISFFCSLLQIIGMHVIRHKDKETSEFGETDG